MVNQPKPKNDLPDRKCSNKEKLPPTSDESRDCKRARGKDERKTT